MVSIDDIIAAEQKRLENILRTAYNAGRDDARRDMLSVLTDGGPVSSGASAKKETSERKRAPRGLPRKLVSRVLYDNDIIGSTPQNVVEGAMSDDEKLIAVTTVRSELRKGEKEGLYKVSNGYWSLTREALRAYEATGSVELDADEVDYDDAEANSRWIVDDE